MERFGEWYILHSRWVGALYCIVPSIAFFVGLLFVMPFRWVYVLRLALSALIGGPVAAWLHAYGVRMWLVKHRSPEGPATATDGAMIGAAVGFSIQVLPALTHFIGTQHMEQTKALIIGAWLGSIAIGVIIGSFVVSQFGSTISTSRAS